MLILRFIISTLLSYIYLIGKLDKCKLGRWATLSFNTKIDFYNASKRCLLLGSQSSVNGNSYIRCSGPGNLCIGNGCSMQDVRIQANKGRITIGSGTFFNHGNIITSIESITIGKNCAFGTNVSMYDHDHVFVREGKQPWGDSVSKPISIGDNCWIGCNVIILKGSTIGNNCVIGAGTVIKGEIPDHSVVYNNSKPTIKEIL